MERLNFAVTSPEVQRVGVKKTELMLAVEIKYGQPIDKVLDHFYWQKLWSSSQVAAGFGVTETTVIEWLKKLRLPIRSKSEALRLSWQDAQIRERRISGAHTPEANKNRNAALRRYYQDHPPAAQDKVELLAEVKEQARLARFRQAFGDEPAATLRLWYWQLGLTIPQIAQKIGRSQGCVKNWMGYLGIERRPSVPTKGQAIIKEWKQELVAREVGNLGKLPPREGLVLKSRYLQTPPATLDSLRQSLGVTSRERVRQIEARALRVLQGGE